MSAIKRIPSLELQTVAFLDRVLVGNEPQSIRLSWNGFRVSLFYEPAFVVSENAPGGPALVISNVYVPLRFRRRGWLTQYWQMCWFVSGIGLALNDVTIPAIQIQLLQLGFRKVEGTSSIFYLQPAA